MTTEKHALGKSMKRKEDPRFLQGKGNYIDDINLPNQLWMALVHSPYPHANIRGIDGSAAMQVPGAVAVVTAKELDAYNVGWLPTFHGLDKQWYLPTVRYCINTKKSLPFTPRLEKPLTTWQNW